MSILSEVYAMGGDALKNMFEVSFQGLPNGIGSDAVGYQGLRTDEAPSYRIKTFTIPSVAISTYEVHYKTAKILFPGGKLEYESKVSTELRIDRYWEVYSDLVAWRNKLASPASGAIGQDVAANRCRAMLVTTNLQALSTTGTIAQDPMPIHGWRFTHIFPMNVPEVAFDYSTGENITMTVEFGFIEMQDYKANGVVKNSDGSIKKIKNLIETEDYGSGGPNFL